MRPVEQMISNAEAHADEAHKLRELADARNLAENLAYQTEKSLKEHREKLDEAEASTIEGRIMELRGVLESQDVNEILSEDRGAAGGFRQKLAEAVYAQAAPHRRSAQRGMQRRHLGRRRGRRGGRLRGDRRGRG